MLLIDKINKNSEVIKHSGAIHVTNSLTLLDRKVINVLLKNAFDDLGKKTFHEIKISDLMQIVGRQGNNDKAIKDCLIKLTTTALEGNIFGKDKQNPENWMVVSLLGSANYFKKPGYCIYEYPELLVEMFKEPNIYAKLDLKVQRNFKSKHSIALWEYLMEILSVGRRDSVRTGEMSIDDFKKMLDLHDDKYKQFKNLNRWIIKPSIKEINKVSNINVELEMVKESRKVVALVFLVSRKTPLAKQQNLKKEELVKEAEMINEITNIANENYLDESPLFKTLTKDFVVSSVVAYELLKTYSEEQIRANLEYIKDHAKNNQIRNYGAFTVKAIRNNYRSQLSSEDIRLAKEKEVEKLSIIEEKRRKEDMRKQAEFRVKRLLSSDWWRELSSVLKEEYGEGYKKWLKEMKPYAVRKKYKDIAFFVPSKFLRDWIRREFFEKTYLSKSNKRMDEVILSVKDEELEIDEFFKEVILIFKGR